MKQYMKQHPEEPDLEQMTGKIPNRLTNDRLFHLVFRNKVVLKGFLSSLLGIPKESIEDIEYLNAVDYGSFLNSKMSILDIRIRMNNLEQIDIELQVEKTADWINRSLYYQCRNFSSDSSIGSNYNVLRPAIHIGILDFNPFPGEEPQFFSKYMLCNVARPEQRYSDNFQICLVQLGCVDKATQEDIANGLTDWATVFNARKWEDIRPVFGKDESIREAVMEMYKMNAIQKIRSMIQMRQDAYRNYWSGINSNYEAALKEGLEKGRQNGVQSVNDQLAALTQCLERDNRESELKQAVTDPDYRKQLLEEYHIS